MDYTTGNLTTVSQHTMDGDEAFRGVFYDPHRDKLVRIFNKTYRVINFDSSGVYTGYTTVSDASFVAVRSGKKVTQGSKTLWLSANAAGDSIVLWDSAGESSNLMNQPQSNYLGVLINGGSAGATVEVSIKDGFATTHVVDVNQNDLVLGQKYYVQADGQLTTTKNEHYAGESVGSNQLLIKGT